MSEEKYDVILVGAGLFGMATAYHLKDKNNDTSC